jgi:cytochrome P450
MLEHPHCETIAVKATRADQLEIPPGPAGAHNSAEDLFGWIVENFEQYGDIYRTSVLGTEVYVVSAPEYCERILRANWQNYARKGQVVKRIALLLGNGLIASNGEFWANQRRMVQQAFSKSAISQMVGMIAGINGELLDKWRLAARRHEAVNVTRDVSSMVLKTTLVAIFGADYSVVAPHFNVLAEEAERNLEFARSFGRLREIILEVIEQRRCGNTAAAATDILGRLMQARDRERGQPMPDAQLSKEVMTLIVAGHETTASLLNWLWYLLSGHSATQFELSAEFDRFPWVEIPTADSLSKYVYTRRVIDEALRLYPPLWLMTRKAIKDDYLGKFFVPAGTEIYISPYVIQRSPQLWDHPDDFDPDRMGPNGSHDRPRLAMCPFGAGPRNCIGEQLARLEIQVHLMMFAKELVLHYSDDKLPEISAGMNLLSKHDLIMLPAIKGQ